MASCPEITYFFVRSCNINNFGIVLYNNTYNTIKC